MQQHFFIAMRRDPNTNDANAYIICRSFSSIVAELVFSKQGTWLRGLRNDSARHAFKVAANTCNNTKKKKKKYSRDRSQNCSKHDVHARGTSYCLERMPSTNVAADTYVPCKTSARFHLRAVRRTFKPEAYTHFFQTKKFTNVRKRSKALLVSAHD